MGTKYSSVSVSSYNANPPSDDGSTSDSNKVKWSTHKTKLSDPIKTALESINTALVTAFDTSARAVTGNDTAAASDHDKTIQVNTSSVTITLSDAATMAAGYTVTVANQSLGSITVALATSTNTIDTVTNATQTISAKEVRKYIVNAATTGYLTRAGTQNPFIDSNPLVVGSSDATKKVRFEVDGLTTGTTRVITVPDADITLPSLAAQSDQETSTSTTTYVSPGRQQFHPSAAKAWAYFTVSGGTVTLQKNYNVTSITKNGTGDYTVNFTTAFSDALYAAVVSGPAVSNGTVQCIPAEKSGGTRTTTALQIVMLETGGAGGGAVDGTRISVVCFGDQ